MAKLTQLQDYNGDILYPQTNAESVILTGFSNTRAEHQTLADYLTEKQNLFQQVTENTNKLDILSKGQDKHTVEIQKVTTDVSNQKNQITQINKSILQHTSQIDSLNSRIDGLESNDGGSAGTSQAINTLTQVQQQHTTEIQKLTEEASAQKSKLSQINTTVDTHTKENITSTSGVHGLRYVNDTLEVKKNGSWEEVGISSSTGGQVGNTSSYGNPNILLNGGFNLWQRGQRTYSDDISTGQYCADRWLRTYGKVRNMSSSGIEWTFHKDENTVYELKQFVEEYNDYDSQILTISAEIDAQEDFSEVFLGVKIDQNKWHGKTFSLKRGETHLISYTFKVDMLFSARFFGCGLKVTNAEPNSTMRIKYIKLECGDTPTPFRPRPKSQELLSCQRYYVTNLVGTITRQFSNTPNNNLTLTMPLPTYLRNGRLNIHPQSERSTYVYGVNKSDYNPTVSLSDTFGGKNVVRLTITPSIELPYTDALYGELRNDYGIDAEIYEN